MLVRSLKSKFSLAKNAKVLTNQVPVRIDPQIPQAYQGVQFSKERLVDFGELPIGEIPKELQSSPHFQQTLLNNSAQILSEKYSGLGNTVSIFLRGGSRYETLKQSGSARILTNLFFRGTNGKSKTELQNALSNLGGRVCVTFERDLIGITLRVEKEDVAQAVNLLCEMVFETPLNEETFQAEKQIAQNQAREISRDQY